MVKINWEKDLPIQWLKLIQKRIHRVRGKLLEALDNKTIKAVRSATPLTPTSHPANPRATRANAGAPRDM